MAPRHHPARLFVEVTTRCNLARGMCVKQSGSSGIPEGTLTPQIFATLAPAFPHLEALVLNGIGEPLLHPGLEEFIGQARRLLPERATVGFQSNGMLLTEPRARSLVDAGLDRVCLSVDSVSEEGFRAIRGGGEMRSLAAALANLRSAAARRPGRPLEIGIEFVLMRGNLGDLPEVIRWAGREGASFAIVTHLLPYHRDLAAQAVYDTNTADAVALYHASRAEARRQGLDLRRYLDVFMKVGRSEDEERVVGIVQQLRGRAAARGVALHLERLLKRDEERLEAADRVFDRARQAAREAGVKLTLPEMAPRNTRKCEFVEGDSAFVSWDGNVHPCYFLWHRYSCFVGGIEKRVKPWVVGDLRRRDVVAIWNDPDVRSFRERVLAYRFPFCYDCGFALCDYVAEADFEQDCHLEQVPCGSCLWCTGLFHCLR
jgi:putative metalloenzyme radical SAM/SPASM domain maturase